MHTLKGEWFLDINSVLFSHAAARFFETAHRAASARTGTERLRLIDFYYPIHAYTFVFDGPAYAVFEHRSGHTRRRPELARHGVTGG